MTPILPLITEIDIKRVWLLGANMALSAKLRVTKLLIKTLEKIYWQFVGHHPPAGDKFSFLFGFD